MDLVNSLTVARGDYRYLRYRQPVACLAGDIVGSGVCVRGDRVNGKWRVQTADPFNGDKMPAIGILISKSTPTVGEMQLIGPCDIFSGLIPGKPYFINGLTIDLEIPDPLVGGYAMVQNIGHAVASDILWLPGNLNMIRRRG